MTTRTRTLMGLALAGVLASATATLAQKGGPDRPGGPAREIGPYIPVGKNLIVNASRVDYILVEYSGDSRKWLAIYLSGRDAPMPRVRAADAAELLKTMGLPPIEDERPAP